MAKELHLSAGCFDCFGLGCHHAAIGGRCRGFARGNELALSSSQQLGLSLRRFGVMGLGDVLRCRFLGLLLRRRT